VKNEGARRLLLTAVNAPGLPDARDEIVELLFLHLTPLRF
jgi:hypothetical protein